MISELYFSIFIYFHFSLTLGPLTADSVSTASLLPKNHVKMMVTIQFRVKSNVSSRKISIYFTGIQSSAQLNLYLITKYLLYVLDLFTRLYWINIQREVNRHLLKTCVKNVLSKTHENKHFSTLRPSNFAALFQTKHYPS